MEVDIRATIPEESYEHTVQDVLRDKEDGWRHDYFSSTKTMFDVPFAKACTDVRNEQNFMKSLSTRLDALSKTIEEAKDPKQPKKETKKLSPEEVEELEEEYIKVYKQKCGQMILIDKLEGVAQEMQWKRYIEVKRCELLHELRNRFMIDGDIDYLRKGVTYVYTYINTLKA